MDRYFRDDTQLHIVKLQKRAEGGDKYDLALLAVALLTAGDGEFLPDTAYKAYAADEGLPVSVAVYAASLVYTGKMGRAFELLKRKQILFNNPRWRGYLWYCVSCSCYMVLEQKPLSKGRQLYKKSIAASILYKRIFTYSQNNSERYIATAFNMMVFTLNSALEQTERSKQIKRSAFKHTGVKEENGVLSSFEYLAMKPHISDGFRWLVAQKTSAGGKKHYTAYHTAVDTMPVNIKEEIILCQQRRGDTAAAADVYRKIIGLGELSKTESAHLLLFLYNSQKTGHTEVCAALADELMKRGIYDPLIIYCSQLFEQKKKINEPIVEYMLKVDEMLKN